MPDSMLDDAIACSENAFKDNKGDIDSKGNFVCSLSALTKIDCRTDKEAYG